MTPACSNMVCPDPRETKGMLGCPAIMAIKENMEPRGREVMRVGLVCGARQVKMEPQDHQDRKVTLAWPDLLVCLVNTANMGPKEFRVTRARRVE